MKLKSCCAALVWAVWAQPLAGQALQSVELHASDGLDIYGEWYTDDDPSQGPVLLLFHQGGSDARGEYGPIIPRLTQAGFDVLAIDQRRGGDLFGGPNRTVEAAGDREFTYCEAQPDLEAALDHALSARPDVRPVLWGSSYSAALVLKLAAERSEEIRGVLSFSPASGDPMAGCDPADFASQVWAPVLVLRPASEMEIPRVAEQLGSFEELGFRTFVADPGSHGSSMLVAERAGGDVEPTWDVVLTFLEHMVNPSVP